MYIPKFIPKSLFTYNSKDRTMTAKDGSIVIKDAVGVSKICNWGTVPLKKKLTATYGKEKAEKILKKSIDRGNKIHKKLEKKENGVVEHFPELGKRLASETFVYGKILSDCPYVHGCIDAIYLDQDNKFHIVEYKTKSKPASFEKHKSENLTRYYKQMYAYKELVEDFYRIHVTSCRLVILFSDKSSPKMMTMGSLDLMSMGNRFLNNLRAYQNSAR